MKWLDVAIILSLVFHGVLGWSLWTLLQGRWETPPDTMEAYLAEPMQMIDLVETANAMRPEKARFIGKQHNTTNEETVALTPPRSTTQATPSKPQPPKPNIGPTGRVAPTTALVETPSPGLLQTIPEDYFRNYRRGRHTYMNVLRHPDIGYFIEIKRALKIAWNPSPIIRQNYRSRIVSRGTVGVVVGAAVDGQGELTELFVLKSSGLPAYDDEALRAFRATFPFFAPPAKLLAQGGTSDASLKMSWSFVFYL